MVDERRRGIQSQTFRLCHIRFYNLHGRFAVDAFLQLILIHFGIFGCFHDFLRKRFLGHGSLIGKQVIVKLPESGVVLLIYAR